MDSLFVTPFEESVCDFFTTMLDCEIQRESASDLQESLSSEPEVVATIKMDGWFSAVVELHLPDPTARALVNRLTGLEFEAVDASVLDGVAESVNIIAGGAKARLASENRPPIDLGLPNVSQGVRNSGACVATDKEIGLCFSSDLGPLSLRIKYASTL